MKTLFVATLAALMASACTWVNVADGAEDIVLARETNVRGCEHLSKVNVKVADRVGPVQRNTEKVAEELITMGKNEAVRLNGDTIVPLDKPSEGRQDFDVYRCE